MALRAACSGIANKRKHTHRPLKGLLYGGSRSWSRNSEKDGRVEDETNWGADHWQELTWEPAENFHVAKDVLHGFQAWDARLQEILVGGATAKRQTTEGGLHDGR